MLFAVWPALTLDECATLSARNAAELNAALVSSIVMITVGAAQVFSVLAVYEQSRRMNVRTKLYQGLKRYRLQYPNATILLIEPASVETGTRP